MFWEINIPNNFGYWSQKISTAITTNNKLTNKLAINIDAMPCDENSKTNAISINLYYKYICNQLVLQIYLFNNIKTLDIKYFYHIVSLRLLLQIEKNGVSSLFFKLSLILF